MNYYVEVLKKYAVFNGRARRKEYWMFVLFNLIIAIGLGFLGNMLGISMLGNLYSLAVLCPAIAAGIRRMHDTNHSGWWLLVPIANLIFAVTDSTPGANQYGPYPKSDVPMMAASV